MSITEAIELGQTGETINELIGELRDAVNSNQGDKDYTFEDEDHKLEYIEDTISMIQLNLTKLKEK